MICKYTLRGPKGWVDARPGYILATSIMAITPTMDKKRSLLYCEEPMGIIECAEGLEEAVAQWYCMLNPEEFDAEEEQEGDTEETVE